ncbi:MAG: RES family NAD+ phosphorylase [Proteobacteria bacterium]|nr:RES family NAD+ phosphorylase [Pseudomonadota bacterium]
MIHDPELLEKISSFPSITFSNLVYRATRKSLDPLAGSTRNGRWHRGSICTALYTSLTSDGAIAEIAYHWGMLTPLPSKPVVLHKLEVKVDRALRLLMCDLNDLGVNENQFGDTLYDKTQEIGTTISFMEFDGLIIPSARWECENLLIFYDNLSTENIFEVIDSTEVDWQKWAKDNNK